MRRLLKRVIQDATIDDRNPLDEIWARDGTPEGIVVGKTVNLLSDDRTVLTCVFSRQRTIERRVELAGFSDAYVPPFPGRISDGRTLTEVVSR